MNLKELEKWLETDEGKQWGEQYKAPLLSNRDGILSELKSANGKISEMGQRLTEAENALKSEKAVTSRYLIDNDLTALLRKENAFEEIIPRLLETMKTAYGLTIKADGNNRKAIGVMKDKEGKNIEAELPDIIADWKKTLESKFFLKNPNVGGGASGGSLTTPNSSALKNIPGSELAKMSDDQFRNVIQNTIGETK
jgi:hypothetical protein